MIYKRKLFFILPLIILIPVVVGIIYKTNTSNPLEKIWLENLTEDEPEKFSDIPDTIGDFVLYGTPEKGRVNSDCDLIPPDIGTGEICTTTKVLQYRNTESGKVVFVHLIEVTKEKELYVSALAKYSKLDKFQDYRIIRIERGELGWFPKSGYDLILTSRAYFLS